MISEPKDVVPCSGQSPGRGFSGVQSQRQDRTQGFPLFRDVRLTHPIGSL